MKRSDFLQRFFAIAGYGSFNLQTIIPKRKLFLQHFFVAGFKHYKGMKILPHMETNDLLELRREPDNEHDDSAIALYWQQEKIGYVPADLNDMLAKLLDAQALPLLGMITHLNKDVKPWENVMAAVYFLQDESVEIPNHAAYLQQVVKPDYKTTSKPKKDKLFEQVFDYDNRIVDVNAITIPEIKGHFQKYFGDQKHTVLYKGKPHIHVATDDIYSFMYNVRPVQWVEADDGKQYILFEYKENAETGSNTLTKVQRK